MRAVVLDSDNGGGFSFSIWDYADQIREIVAEWIVGGLIGLIDSIANGLSTIFDEVLLVIGDAQSIVILPFSVLGDAVLVGIRGIDSILVSTASALGPASPLVFVLSFVVMLGLGAATFRVLIELVRFI